MAVVVEFDIPVYFVQEFKRKENKTWLVGLSWYRNAHFAIQNSVKQHYHKLISDLLEPHEMSNLCPLMSYKVSYTYFYKTITTDMPNIVAFSSKVANDAFQELGYVINDNVQHLQEEHYYVGGRDSANPRVHVVLETLT
jgi:hypothetical protein